MDTREILHVTGRPLYIFTQKQMREALGIPHRRVRKLIHFDRDEVTAWAKRWSRDAKDQGIAAKAAPGQPAQIVAASIGIAARLIAASAPPAYWPAARGRCCARRRAISSARPVSATA
ncbi:MAG: hypothetical protein LBI87_11825 [Candidatus Accumulibacter sp.]|jgi:hypothetical protein|nr:hypothetical protein [Accumulibacter sp.]